MHGSMSGHFTCPLVACGLRAHFTFLPTRWQKHFTFRQSKRGAYTTAISAEKFHVLRRRTSLTLIDFVRRGRRSYLPVYNDMLFPITINAGQALLRVRRRAMDLRAGLDGGGAGCPIAVLSSPRRSKMCVKTRPHACPYSPRSATISISYSSLTPRRFSAPALTFSAKT